MFRYSTSFARNGRVRAEVYIDCGDKAKNEAIFDWLHAQKNDIQAQFGSADLHWERLDTKRTCRVAIYRDGDIEVDSDQLAEIRKWAIESLLRFKLVFPKRLAGTLSALQSGQ